MVPRSLPRLRIAVACNADWNAMVGNDRARVCGQCCQTVYNVERLRPREVAALLERHGDRVPCLRLFQRPDGTIVTRGCLTWVTDGVRRVRMGFLSVAALTLGFWSNVFLWRGRLHPTPSAPAAASARPAPPPTPRSAVDVKREELLKQIERERGRHIMGAIGRERDPAEELRELARPPATEVTMARIQAALKPHIAALEARGLKAPAWGRANVTLTVKPSGRVGRVGVTAPPEVQAQGEKLIRAAAKQMRLPRHREEYQVEFAVLFQRGE